jgi:hypothetical protein
MDHQKITQLGWDADRVNDLMPSVNRNPWGCTALETLEGSQLFAVDHGPVHLLIATKGLKRGAVATLEITGLVSTGARAPAGAVGRALDQLANIYRADLIAFYTPHAHIQRGALRLGFLETGRLLMKQVDHYGQQ